MKKRPASILLIVCLLLSLLPASVFAATEYDLYINEFRFTSTNLTYTGEVGSAVYSPQTKTLSLNNLTISTSRTNALIYSNIPGLTINVYGTTTINLLDSSPIGGSDIGQEQANHAFMLEADTTIKGQSGNKSIDKIVINSKSIGVANPEPDGTTRVGISSFSQLTLQNITLSMTDNSVTNKVGYASLIRAGGYTSISGCTLDAQKCAHGVFMLEKAAANIAGTEFSMNLNGTLTSGMNFSPGTTNLVSNCSGTINATYPLYSQGSVTVSNAVGGKLTLNGTGAAAVAAENKGAAGGKLLFQDANVVLTSSDSYGIHLQPNASAELKRSTVDVTAPNICVYVDENAKLSLTDGSDQTCRLYLKGTNTAEGGSIGIYAKGSVSFDAGLLSISNVYTAIQNMRTGTVDFSGGNHTLNAAACGYLNNGTGKLKIGGNVNVTVNALIGIQLTKDTGGMLQMSDGTLNLNCGETGLRLQNGAGKTTLSGGRLNITGTGSTPAADGIMAYSAIEFSGTEVFFQHCKRDLISLNGANKLTAGKLSLSGSNMGAQLSGGFEMSGGELVSDCANLGVVVTDGTAALKNGKLTLNAGYPLYLQSGGVLDFAGAEVKATATENCALYVDPNTADGASSYRITGGTVVLQSTQAAANAVYTSLPANYGVWVGADEASAAPVSTVTQPVLARNKYARFAEKQSYTLTLVNVKEGSSATVVGGDAITYTAADAPEGQHFSRWELTVGTSTTSVGTNATYTGTMPHSDATLTAVYESCRGGTATCKERATCEVCGKPYGSLAPHSYTAEVADAKYLKTEADCDHAAVYYKSCTGCGESSEGTEFESTFTHGEPLGHDWGAWTSNGDGTHTRVCARDAAHTETKPCHGGTADCTHKPVCEDCGAEYGELSDHSYTAEVADAKYLKTEADCDHAAVYYKSCTGCGESSKGTEFEATFESGEPLGHDWGAWTSNGDDTHTRVCTRDAAHTETKDCHGGTADCTHKPVCEDCGTEYGKLGEHSYTAEVADAKYLKTEADCDHAAVYYKSCTGCGESSKGTEFEATFESGEPLGHEWGAWTSNGDDTHTRVCARDAAHTETKPCHGGIADCNHKPVCEDCGAEYGTGTNHDFTAEIVGEKYLRSEADCDYAAVYYKSCTRCGESSEGAEQEATFKSGAPLGHTPVTDPETELLTQGEHCSVCGAVLTAQQPKLASFWTDEGNYDAALYASEPGDWVIYDAADLAALAKKVESGSTFKGCTVTLAADIDLSGHLWIPIGYFSRTASGSTPLLFEGTFDGGLHKITGMFACPQGYSRSIAEVGLFGYVNEGTVRDLLLFGTVSYSSAIGGSNAVGGLVGFLNEGTLQNCGFVGSVYLYSGNAFSHDAGGLTGYAWSSRIENCYAIASVEASVPRSTISVGGVGGATTGWSGPLTVRNCYLAVKLRATAVENTRACIGGLAPENYLSGEGHTVENNFVQHGFAVKGYVKESALNGTLLRKSAMQSDTLLTALNDYISRNPGSGMRAWTLDPAQNGGYPGFGVSVWFLSNQTGVENSFSALPFGGKAEAYAPTATGYDFVGWYTDEALTEAFDFTQPVTENIVLYAKWKLHVCTPGACMVGENGLHYTLCTVCGERLDCEYTEAVIDPTCTSAGYTVHTCTNCGNSYIDAIVEGGHKWSTTVIPPTHTEPGYTLYECSVCKESYKTDYTAPAGHVFDEGTVTKPATCTEDGEMTYACSCGATHTAPIPKTDHELADTVTAPTCTELGFTTHACKHCDYTYTDTPVAALGHKWDSGKVAAAPTLTETGTLLQTCTVCKATKESVIPMLSDCDGGEGCPSSAYKDAPAVGNWAHVGIDFVLKSGLFYGTSDTTFSPDGAMTRAMLVTVLYRLEGQPKVTAKNPFSDVADGRWYTDAVVWAAENKIVNGVGEGKFDPDGEITREQMAAILYRYSEFKGVTPTEGKFAAEYPDAGKVSKYALAAMRWANAEKLINGTQSGSTVYLDPQGSATRAQVAAILMRFVQNIL